MWSYGYIIINLTSAGPLDSLEHALGGNRWNSLTRELKDSNKILKSLWNLAFLVCVPEQSSRRPIWTLLRDLKYSPTTHPVFAPSSMMAFYSEVKAMMQLELGYPYVPLCFCLLKQVVLVFITLSTEALPSVHFHCSSWCCSYFYCVLPIN